MPTPLSILTSQAPQVPRALTAQAPQQGTDEYAAWVEARKAEREQARQVQAEQQQQSEPAIDADAPQQPPPVIPKKGMKRADADFQWLSQQPEADTREPAQPARQAEQPAPVQDQQQGNQQNASVDVLRELLAAVTAQTAVLNNMAGLLQKILDKPTTGTLG